MKHPFFIFALGALVLSSTLSANEIDFVEQYALATDREQALKQLIPGTEQYYFYNCLFHQSNERYDRVEQLLKEWQKRHGRTTLQQQIQHRQALLTYATNPKNSLTYIKKQLGLKFNHRREQLDAKPNLPTSLDDNLLLLDRLDALARRGHDDLAGFTDSALRRLAATTLNPIERRDLLSRLRHPDVEDLPSLVVKDLKHKGSRGFGSLPIHRLMFIEQLEECVRQKPDLLNATKYVDAYVEKLRPNDDVLWRYDVSEREAYLDRLMTFVDRLSAAHNSLKANVLYQRLVHDRSVGKYDKRLFLEYVQLPKSMHYVSPRYLKGIGGRHAVNLQFDGRETTQFAPIVNDESLVRSYLQHFFVKADSYREFEAYIKDTYLKQLFAETKLLHGLGDAERWYSMLPPAQLQQLRDRVDLEFETTNQTVYGADDDVSLELSVKNVQSLIVKVFEINTGNYFRTNRREINTDIDLDGLVANHEETFQYDESPLRRTKRHFDFPQLKKPGVYVVDFIGNGTSSRAIIRKGTHRFLVHTGPNGQVFRVQDENNRPLKSARLWMGGQEYDAKADGTITVPFSTNPGRESIVINHDGLSSLHHFHHESEQYELHAGLHVDRESLLRHHKSAVLMRTALMLNGMPISLSVLENPKLTIHSTDLDGIESMKEIVDVPLHEDRESLQFFQVPPRLAKIRLTLSATVKSLSENKDIQVTASSEYQLNGIDRLPLICDLHLTQVDGEYVVELRGKTGEPLPDRIVTLQLKHRDYTNTVDAQLKTDSHGTIRLGRLTNITEFATSTPSAPDRVWHPIRDRHAYYKSVHAVQGKSILIPFMTEPATADKLADWVSLVEMRGNIPVANRIDHVQSKDGFLSISGLGPGNYRLRLREERQSMILRVTKGRSELGFALGKRRQLEQRGTDPLQIRDVTVADAAVTVRLTNSNRFTRVHVFATRYIPERLAYDSMHRVRDPEPAVSNWPARPSLFVAGRDIGEEYRYIIDRKYSDKFPGNMLLRPSPLLNPWATRSTETEVKLAASGSDFASQPSEGMSDSDRQSGLARKSRASDSQSASLDFLAEASAVLVNMKPDENGIVTIDREQLGSHQHIHIVAVDHSTTAYRSTSLDSSPPDLNDLRLADHLDPDGHFTQRKQVTVVAKGESFVVDDIVASRFDYYDSIQSLYNLYTTMNHDSKLAKFEFIRHWDALTEEDKRDKYSEFACHELNFFLSRKDPDFFREVIEPYLTNKFDKTFFDQWLLEEPLELHRKPWRYSQLNVAERVLLGRRVDEERDFMRRHVDELFQLVPRDISRTNWQFGLAISGRVLMESSREDLRSSLRRKLAKSEILNGYRSDLSFDESEPAIQEGTDNSGESRERIRDMSVADGMAIERDDDDDSNLQGGGRFAGRESVSLGQLYRQLDATKEWIENNYYELTIDQQSADLIGVNAFWKDVSVHDADERFLSKEFNVATASFAEMMFALALMDLPFDAGKHAETYEKERMTIVAASPMIVFHEQIEKAEAPPGDSPILVSQSFFRHGDRYRMVDGMQQDKFISEEFLIHTVYGCQVVITNTSSSQRQVEMLVQIPQGAIPVLGGKATHGGPLDLPAYQTQTHEFYFYFPAAGDFAQFPVHVAEDDAVLASAAPFVFHVVNKPTSLDKESWEYVSQYASNEEVLEFLSKHNLKELDLSRMAFRMKDKSFFHQTMELLGHSHAYDDTLWSYSVEHDYPEHIREYLQHNDAFVAQLGDHLNSRLLAIDPVIRKTYQHMDYRPLVNARAHRLGRKRTILNGPFHAQYHRLMNVLAYQPEVSNDDLMSITYYMLLQDRIADGIEYFSRIQKDKLDSQLQYDYFAAFLDCFHPTPELARSLAAKYVDHPVARWRNAFRGVQSLLDEVDGKGGGLIDETNRTQRQNELAGRQPNLEFDIENNSVSLRYRNLSEVTVNYYLMDLELLFSRSPFVQQITGRFSSILPNQSRTVELPKGDEQIQFELPDSLNNQNVLVEISGGGKTVSSAYYANSLAVQVVENFGQLQVTHKETGKPLPTVYVKTYAKMHDGSVKFFKDGYTDLRGIFEYSSLSTGNLDSVSRFSLLISSDEHGAVIKEASPPKR